MLVFCEQLPCCSVYPSYRYKSRYLLNTVHTVYRESVDREVRPGQLVEYVVFDGTKLSRDLVALVGEADDYDADHYSEQMIRAAESVLSPLGGERAKFGGIWVTGRI